MTTEAYEQTVRRMRPQLMELGLGFTSDRQQVEDAVQEALLRLWLLRDRVGDTRHAEALLVRILKNVCVNQWRRQRRHNDWVADVLAGWPAEEAQPMAEDDNVRMLQQAVRTLPPSEQRLFRMRHELDMEVQQIAAVTGLLPSSVSSIISVARRKIIQQLKKGGIL